MADDDVEILQLSAEPSHADPGGRLGVQSMGPGRDGECREAGETCLGNKLVNAFPVIDERRNPQLLPHFIGDHRAQGGGVGRIVIIAVLHQRLVDEVSAGHEISAASAAGDDEAQVLGPDVLFVQKVADGLFPQVHLVENVFHACDGGPIHI